MPLDKNATLADDTGCRTLIAARLTVERGIAPYRTILLYVAACSIGRDAANPLPLDDQRVSRIHAALIHRDGGFWLQDAGSRNGTFINNEPCAEPTPIIAGDTIRFGQYVALRVG